MNEIAEYERRISEALSRIAYGIETLQTRPQPVPEGAGAVWDAEASGADAPPSDPQAASPLGQGETDDSAEIIEALHAELLAEREASQQLSERLRAIREKQEATEAALERNLGRATRLAEAATGEIARLKRANAELITLNAALMASDGAVEPHLINRSMQAELEALRAARAAEAQELAELIAALEPLAAQSGPEFGADQKEATDA